MSIYKQIKDHVIKAILSGSTVPVGLSELNHYFRIHGPITFNFEKQDDGSVVAMSTNFLYGKIITHAANKVELDQKIQDAILTAFEVPSSYAKEAGVHRVEGKEYAFA